MKIAEFAKSRNVSIDTIHKYIRRNSEAFDGHITNEGKRFILDEEAVRLLNEKYPLPRPIEVIDDIETIKELSETRRELADAQKRILDLQGQLLSVTAKLAHAEAMEMMLEDKKNQLLKAENEISDLRIENRTNYEKLSQLESANTEHLIELERLKNRGLIERILNK